MAVPLFHITALSPIAMASIPAGGKIIMMRKWDPAQAALLLPMAISMAHNECFYQALDIIEREKVTRFTGVPTMVQDMLVHPNFTPKKTATLKNMAAGGAPVPPSQIASMREKAAAIKPAQVADKCCTASVDTESLDTC